MRKHESQTHHTGTFNGPLMDIMYQRQVIEECYAFFKSSAPAELLCASPLSEFRKRSSSDRTVPVGCRHIPLYNG